jgi:DNA (cytosine-5)-methyltransferase 1
MGWKPVGFSEIEKFPSQVLAHHYPQVTNFGDMTKYKEWKINDSIGLLVGGTPCQSFSVAGLRKGLEDPRGNLALTYVGILDHFRPKWFIWENVPGVLSSGGGRDFGSFLGALGELGYGWSYRVLDAQYFGVAQRRRRVFVVGCLGDWRPTAEVLFESESLRRDIKKGKSKGKDIAGYVKSGFGQYREDAIAGTLRASGGDLSGGSETFVTNDTVGTLLARDYKGVDSYNTDKMIVQKVYENHPSDSRVKEMGKTCQTVTSTWGSGGGNIPFVQNIAYEWHNQDSRIKPIQVAATLNCNAGGREGHLVQSIGFTQCDAARDVGQNISPTLRSGGDGGYPAHSVATNMAVRRLTPVECERLQGFPDNYTNIKENCPDGARYKALGNSMAVPVMRWIGERINSYETMRSSAVVQVETGVGLAKV